MVIHAGVTGAGQVLRLAEPRHGHQQDALQGRVRAFLSRQGETTGPMSPLSPLGRGVGGEGPVSAIGDVQVSADMDRKGVTCRAGVGDFAPADLVVVQVDVAVYFR